MPPNSVLLPATPDVRHWVHGNYAVIPGFLSRGPKPNSYWVPTVTFVWFAAGHRNPHGRPPLSALRIRGGSPCNPRCCHLLISSGTI
eukprot:843522-Amorphochlora_amoeboformis.AAC.2